MSAPEIQETDRDEFKKSYRYTMLWANVVGPEELGDDPLNFSSGDGEAHAAEIDEDLTPEIVALMDSDCDDFIDSAGIMLSLAVRATPGYDFGSAGHDFALTRNGHGAGYFDRGLGDYGQALSEAANAEGSMYIYVGDPRDPRTWDYESG